MNVPIASQPSLNRLRDSTQRAWRWYMAVRTDDPVRKTMNQGLLLIIAALLSTAILTFFFAETPTLRMVTPIGVMIAIACIIPTRRGGTLGAWILVVLLASLNPLVFDPKMYIGPPIVVHVLFLLSGALAAVVIRPRYGVLTVLAVIASLLVRAALNGVSTEQLIAFAGAASADLLAILTPILVLSTLFSRELRERAALTTQLEQRVADRTADLASSNERLSAIMRQREAELTAVVHDLDNGLTAVRTGVDMLMLEAAEAGVEQTALAEAERLVLAGFNAACGLAGDLRTSALLDNAALTIQSTSTDPAALVGQVLNQMSAQVAHNGIALQSAIAPDLPLLSIDARRIERVLANLLSNAIKYTRDAAEPTISVCASTANGGVQVSVQDNGRGMTAAELACVGRPFTRHTSAAGTEGMGVGLYVCRGVVAAHGGSLHFASDGPGCGTIATLWLPRDGTIMIKDKLVLVVEDDASIGLGLSTVLRRSGGAAQVELIAGYMRAVRRLEQGAVPGLVITDYRLIDRYTGVDLALWLLGQPKLAQVPRVLYTSTDLATIRAELAMRVAQDPGLAGMTLETLFVLVVAKHPSRGPHVLVEALQDRDTAPASSS